MLRNKKEREKIHFIPLISDMQRLPSLPALGLFRRAATEPNLRSTLVEMEVLERFAKVG